MTSDSVIEISGMTFAYEGSPVLQGVSLDVRAGDFAYVVGPNGGGKTTLLKIILGLLQPNAGVVRVFGAPPQHARRRIGYVPQYHRFDSEFPVRMIDVVLMGRLHMKTGPGPYRRRDRTAALDAIRRAGLNGLDHALFAQLSGGQRQRTLIARALAGGPDLLLLDEPTAHVDVVAVQELMQLLQVLNEHMTILMVSHDLGFVSHPIKNVICVNRTVQVHPARDMNGRIISELYGQEMHAIQHHQHLHGDGEQ